MKKTLFIIAVCALAAVSCQKEMAVDNGSISEGILTVTADIAQFGADTKTSIDGAATTIKPLWSEGDEIKLFATDGTSAIYVLNAADKDKASATFTLKDGQTALAGTFACAYYPAVNATSYVDGTGITANIPSQQAYVVPAAVGENQGSFANGAFPMVGTGTLNTEGKNLNLTFKNVFGLVQLNFTGTETIKQIELVSSQSLSGVATIAIDGSCSFTNGSNFVDLTTTAETQPTLDGTAKAFYIAVPAGSTVSKIYVTTTSTSTRPLFKAKDITVSRSKIASLKSSTLSGAGFDQVAEYQEATDQLPVVVAGSVWAPVNCGYEPATVDPAYKGYPYGKLYPWGRKYGQGYCEGTYEDADYPGKSGSSSVIAEMWTYSNGAENPLTFYKNGGTNSTYTSDWIKSGDNTYWNTRTEEAPEKTDHDPCPEGWRIPTYAELNALIGNQGSTNIGKAGWDATNKGYWFNGTKSPCSENGLFLPAAGARNYNSCGAQNRGALGNYWSSSVDETKAWYLSFNKNSAHMRSQTRAQGFSVRCVKK